MSISITVQDKTPELFQKLDAAIGRFVIKGAAYVEGQLKASMAEPKSGKRYGRHIASAPGESPAVDSSNLTGSITTIMANSLEAKIGTAVGYAPLLETGTSRMAARPLWAATAADALPTLENILRAELKGV